MEFNFCGEQSGLKNVWTNWMVDMFWADYINKIPNFIKYNFKKFWRLFCLANKEDVL